MAPELRQADSMARAIAYLRRSPVARIVLLPWRLLVFGKVLWRDTTLLLRWLVASRETTNLTYHLSQRNQYDLAALLSVVTNRTRAECQELFEELLTDARIRDHVSSVTTAHEETRGVADPDARFGGRIGWYALVRILKPRVVVEGGVDKGLGALVICAALERNAAEGHEGTYIGYDVDRTKGWLLTGPYARFGSIEYIDVVRGIESLDIEVNLYISETAVSSLLERAEYQALRPKLSTRSIVVGAMAHSTDELRSLADETGRAFLCFREDPLASPYRGAWHGYAWHRQ